MKIKADSRLLFIGDSITDCGREYPIGEGAFEQSLGLGYVSLVNAFLIANHPENPIHIINMGVSGNTVRDLKARWTQDVMNLQPDYLSIKIGINDVWRSFSAPEQRGRQVAQDEFAQTLDGLIQQVKPILQGLVLMTPYFLEPDKSEPMRARMDQYGEVVKELAEKYDAILVDTQAALDRAMQNLHPMQLAFDRVHMNLAGHMILAQAFLETVLKA